jgi:hypothetical protein
MVRTGDAAKLGYNARVENLLRSSGLCRKAAGWMALALFATAGIARAQTDLTLRGDSVDGYLGQNVTLDFRVENFWQITEGIGTIQWDPHVIDYVSAGDFGIPAINAGTFSRIPEGMLTFDWSSGANLGDTLPNGTVLFSLTFEVRGNPGEMTTVAFTNGWTPLQFESPESDNLPFSTVSGNVAVVPEPGGTAAVLALGILALVASRRWVGSGG